MNKPHRGPNLFTFASSELSQDAFFAWLLRWADAEFKAVDPSHHELGTRFVKALLKKKGIDESYDFQRVEVRKQFLNIDILAVIDEDIVMLIEDKAGSVDHSNQLARYPAALAQNGFRSDKIIPVYIQTGEQPDYADVHKENYALVQREELIALLNEHVSKEAPGSIVGDFLEHLIHLNERYAAFLKQPFNEWDEYAWQGFFSWLQKRRGNCKWGYVSNPSGGFFALWWKECPGAECVQYLQLEQEKLCFKIGGAQDRLNRKPLRTQWHNHLWSAAEKHKFPIRKPSRFGFGETMTVAVYGGDYRCNTDDGALDISHLDHILNQAQRVLEDAVRLSSESTSGYSRL